MSVSEKFFLNRRSVIARKMLSESIDKDDLNTIIAAGLRVPDHGALSPWKLIVYRETHVKDISIISVII